MKKLYETILGFLSSLIIFSSPAGSKGVPKVSQDYHVPDTARISSLNQVELVRLPPPLILKQSDFEDDGMFAAHRSHRSHSSHRSHASHRSGSVAPSRIPETTVPMKPPTTEKVSPPAPVVPQRSPASQPSDSTVKEWKTSAEWVSQPCKLSYHEVVIYFHDDTRLQGMVTGCQDKSIQVVKEASGAGETKQWVNIGEIKALLWR